MTSPDNATKFFGYLIAYVIPGFVGLYAISLHVPQVSEWLGLARTQSTEVGGVLFAMLASLGIGVFFGGVREMLLERFLVHETHRGPCSWTLPSPLAKVNFQQPTRRMNSDDRAERRRRK